MPSDEAFIIKVNQSQQQKIQKVPRLLRGIKYKDESKNYAPMVVSIGPFYHGDEEYMEMEKLKLEYASTYFPGLSEQMYPTMIKANEVRKFYSDELILPKFANDNEKFSKMIFLDGCFILYFISSFFTTKGVEMKPYLRSFVIRDLFLLENQLPYSVLHKLMNLRRGYSKKEEEELTLEKIIDFIENVRRTLNDDKKGICKFICEKFGFNGNRNKKPTNNDSKNELLPLHLVELFHSHFTKENPTVKNKCHHLVDLFHCQCIKRNLSSSKRDKLKDKTHRYPSAKELKSVGVHFKKSQSYNFDDVDFKSYFVYGYLTLPPFLVDELSKPLLLNLAAYESCPDTPDPAYQVSSYIVFLNSLIDKPEDVKELRSKGILLNSLGSDQDMVDLFNEISKYLVMDDHAFPKARDGINHWYQDSTKKWITEWLSDHFSSPWTILAFVGATLGLVLAALDTYNSFYPPSG
ncbi:hypothetical protein M5689_011806 [Euphorbia peplus]|nr:hypothetical protein M5689_011806 [Euphorbia peplus]